MSDSRSCVFEERVRDAIACKEKGNKHFLQGNWTLALEAYRQSLYHVEFEELSWNFELLPLHRKTVNKVRVPSHLNVAACVLKCDEASGDLLVEAREACDKAIKLLDEEEKEDASSDSAAEELANAMASRSKSKAKALFRRGSIFILLNDSDNAIRDLKEAARLAPKNAQIRKAYARAQQSMQEEKLAQSSFWKSALEGKILKMSEEVEEKENENSLLSSCSLS